MVNISPIAPTRNIAAFSGLVTRLITRRPDVPGLGCFYGRAGLGKSKAATFGANMARATYVECNQFTTAKSLLLRILSEMGVHKAKGSVPDLLDLATERMAMDPSRLLIIDEAHWIAHKRFIDIARALHDLSRAPIILIGEEMLPTALETHDRVHSRILEWVEASPCNLEDMMHLIRIRAPGLVLAPELINLLLDRTRGNARRIVVNLADIVEESRRLGVNKIGLDQYDAARIRVHKAPTVVRRAV
ncbi:MAG: ATP-binding protein [Hyphomicrobiales bacterium]|nr:ATP-binding protein [Hyphomicrobiales bacterium]MDE2113857.1 ATP-binding protein [Hyphomicrobiales bacterium]